MVTSKTILLYLLSLLCLTTITEAQTCNESRCPRIGSPTIRFPFRLNRTQPRRCGYPGFDLSCDGANNETTINVPGAGKFAVDYINYMSETIRIRDPENCLPRRLLDNFRVGFPFQIQDSLAEFTFLNCTGNGSGSDSYFLPISCLSGEDYTVGAVYSPIFNESEPRPCRVVATVQVPMRYPDWSGFLRDVSLTWVRPECAVCELQGGTCGFRSNTGLRVGCMYENGLGSSSSSKGIPRAAKYGIIIGVGIPGFLIAVGIVFHLSGKVAANARRRQLLNTTVSPSIAPNPMIIRMGLDRPTIESYPKTMLGASKRLPNPSDNTCAICLSDYQASETLRTIPDCKHYFHSDCIDEWLRLNGTCPMCRNSPDGSSVFTSSSSSSSSMSPP